MLSLLEHVHACQRSIDAKSLEAGSTDARNKEPVAEPDMVPSHGAKRTPSPRRKPKHSSPRKSPHKISIQKQKPARDMDKKRRGHPHKPTPKRSVPKEVTLHDGVAEAVSPLRNPKARSAPPTNRKSIELQSLVKEDKEAPREFIADPNFDESVTEISMDDFSITEPSGSNNIPKKAESLASRRSSINSDNCESEGSMSSSVLSDLEIRSKGTMKSRPCYSEIKGHVAPCTPQKSPTRRFSIDNGQLLAVHLAATPLAGTSNTSEGKNSRRLNPTDNDNNSDEERSLPGADRYLRRVADSPIRRVQSLTSTSNTEHVSQEVLNSPVSPSKRCSLASANLLQSLKDTYSPRNRGGVMAAKDPIICSLPTPKLDFPGRKHLLESDASCLDLESPRKSPRRTESKGCLPALSPGLASPTKTRNNGEFLLLFSPKESHNQNPTGSRKNRRQTMSTMVVGTRNSTSSNTPYEKRNRRSSMSPACQSNQTQNQGDECKHHSRRHRRPIEPNAETRSRSDEVDTKCRTGNEHSKRGTRRNRRQTLSHLPVSPTTADAPIYPEKEQVQKYLVNELEKMHKSQPEQRPRRQTMAHVESKTEVYPDKDNLREYIARQLGVPMDARVVPFRDPSFESNKSDSTDVDTSDNEGKKTKRSTKRMSRNSKAA